MSNKTPHRTLSPAELQNQLSQQINLLKQFCISFDGGLEDIAGHIAVIIRVLVHQTNKSTALLTQLSQLNQDFLDTAHPLNPSNQMSHSGLLCLCMSKGATKYVPMLNENAQQKMVAFSTWWESSVFVDKSGNQISRKGLILAMSNQDGGAHVDPAIEETYYQLTRENSLNWQTSDPQHGTRPMEGPEKAAVRQIAHEVLCTLDSQYAYDDPYNCELRFFGMEVTVSDTPPPARYEPRVRFNGHKVQPNETCPFCKSGQKFKKCCGKTI